MDPSAQNAQNIQNLMQEQVNSSQLGGGANGDHSRINGDQVILNPLSTQIRDRQQQQMAAQIAATNRAQAVVQAQVKQAQQIQQKLPPGTVAGTSPSTSQSPAAPPQQSQIPASQPPQAQSNGNVVPQGNAQPVKPSVPSQNQVTLVQSPQVPVQQQPNQQAVQQFSQPVKVPQTQSGGALMNPPAQGIPAAQGNMQQVQQSPQPVAGVLQAQAPQQPTQQPVTMQGTIQSSAPQNPAPQGVIQQPQIMQPQVQPGMQPPPPGIVQNSNSQGSFQQMQQPAQQVSGTIQSPAPQNLAMQNQIPQTQPVQFQQGAPGQTAPGTMQGPTTQPVSFQNQQAIPQTAPVSFQTFSAPQQVQGTNQNTVSQQNGQDPNASQQSESDPNQATLSAQQAIADTFIPVTQLISSNHDPIQDLHHTVASSNVPDELRVILNDRIKRLGLIKEGAGLSSMYILELESTTRYINACVSLPWVEKTEDTLDLAKAKEILDKHHYGLDLLKNRMLEFIASIMLNLKNNGPDFASRSPILCFVGLAGTGKTTFAKSMAEALGRKFERIPFGGMADSRALRGQSRYFPDAEPGAFLKALSRAKSKNPVLLLDEIDRVTETARADIMGVLIEALDPEQNAAFTDHYIDYPFSLQNCLFVATSNNISTIATAVLDRMEIIQMPNYNDEEKKVIGRDYVLPKVRKQMGLREDQLIIDDDVWDAMIRPLGYDPGVRALDRIIGMICRRAARMIVAGEAENVRVTINNMKPFVQDF